jgi:POT family proton-dependent oligopeptide transporter
LNAIHNILRKKDVLIQCTMGVNAGAFLGIMLCGYIGEKILSWGFD